MSINHNIFFFLGIVIYVKIEFMVKFLQIDNFFFREIFLEDVSLASNNDYILSQPILKIVLKKDEHNCISNQANNISDKKTERTEKVLIQF